ncbi:hypothetical protein RHMOL_Rhmol07G0175300 [Rhododendron molle]|uniref:Uncharacterized protein n=1 Tax=Rhododendron molle TaxID=49168 RepID=A0ACC0N3A6_RHOML|nr:hypothetical protein RHMOL_Rhmol07G0175300 [Rhododendron molle]
MDTRRRRSSYLLRFGRASDVLNRYMMMKVSATVVAVMEGGNSAMVVMAMDGDEGRRGEVGVHRGEDEEE